jgi:hypothetical protein
MKTEVQLRGLFNQAFDSLPPKARTLIEDLWRKNGISTDGVGGAGRFSPPIFKEGIILNRNVRPRPMRNWSGPISTTAQMINAGQQACEVVDQSRGVCGQTDGLIFRFKTSVVDNAPDETLKILVVHELAHAYRAAEVGQPFPEAAITRGTTEAEEEKAANSLVAEWGFNLAALLQWLHEHEGALRL